MLSETQGRPDEAGKPPGQRFQRLMDPGCRDDFPSALIRAAAQASEQLLRLRGTGGYWEGELSSSALSTATAVCALAVVARHRSARNPDHLADARAGLTWLANHQNTDGGWGDTTISLSNISTTALCWAAFGSVPGADADYSEAVHRAESWLAEKAGGIQPDTLAPAIIRRYGKDRTFSVPILTMCALAGRLGHGRDAWRWVIPLPFELAAFPHWLFAILRLPVVSYALPALIAVGQARHHHRPSRNPLIRVIRTLLRNRTLRVLAGIQPSSGGFLEAAPLTSFVVMSLASSGRADHSVTGKGVEFLTRSIRPDGSWPIDTNLATWVTTLSANALPADKSSNAHGQDDRDNAVPESWNDAERKRTRDWLLDQQYLDEHPYTHAAPGGWAWTDLPGGVPDADDTAGALLALRHLGDPCETHRAAALRGIVWLLNIQNRDGGIPTFCKGWGSLPFDRSSPDLTAHALRAWLSWMNDSPENLQLRTETAIRKALAYLARVQRSDGSWVPLWFGNQHAPEDENKTYGTSRVLCALAEFEKELPPSLCGSHGRDFERTRALARTAATAGIRWLLTAQQTDGSWSGFPGGIASVEETALATEALAAGLEQRLRSVSADEMRGARAALQKGASWLIRRIDNGEWLQPSPIGFYFAKLWYFETLYPRIFTVAALNRVRRTLRSEV